MGAGASREWGFCSVGLTYLKKQKNKTLFCSFKVKQLSSWRCSVFYTIQILAFLAFCLQTPAKMDPSMELPNEGTLL